MNPYIEKLKAYLDRHPKEREEFKTVSELLCHYYTVEHFVERGKLRAELEDMGQILETLSRKDNDALFCAFIRICDGYVEQAFMTGLRTGAALTLELQCWQ